MPLAHTRLSHIACDNSVIALIPKRVGPLPLSNKGLLPPLHPHSWRSHGFDSGSHKPGYKRSVNYLRSSAVPALHRLRGRREVGGPEFCIVPVIYGQNVPGIQYEYELNEFATCMASLARGGRNGTDFPKRASWRDDRCRSTDGRATPVDSG